ncbi:MAG TPA: aminoacyl-tRNA hydrolase [Bacteroidota bacterium]|nr:aminoacyl-tRNA hydrolase [Bacteroidota bacterium]
MHLIVGLGNPGRQYEYTRHNIGFLVVNQLAASLKATFRPAQGEYWIASCSLNGLDVVLMKPTTYMNNSGIAVQQFLEAQTLPLEQLLVVCDDIQLPLGSLRIRTSGSDGGHNGLASIIYHIQSENIPRLRCGIGSEHLPTDKSSMVDFVLSEFETDEQEIVGTMIQHAADACCVFITKGIVSAMNQFNNIRPATTEI